VSSEHTPENETADSGGVLYVVATPIGHLDDVTRRALEILGAVDLILCEDTRRTRILLRHYDITGHCESFHDHNERRKTPTVIAALEAGRKIALVTDAGTPLVSDPGYRLVNGCVDCGIPVVPIPGASAVTALLSVAGLPTDRFYFEGFLPPRGAKRTRRIDALAGMPCTIVLFESPYRLERTLDALREGWGDRRGCMGRELTKKFEEIRRGTLSELAAWAHGRTIRGEITLAIEGADTKSSR